MTIPEDFDRLLDEYGLAQFREAIIKSSKPSIRLKLSESGPASEHATKIGGLPQLPPNTEWPRIGKLEALSFVGQINLREISKFPGSEVLPHSGSLSFFYDVINQPWGGYEHGDSWRVIYVEEGTPTTKLDPPDKEVHLVPLLGVDMAAEMTFPAPRSIEIEHLPFDEDRARMAKYFGFRDELVGLMDHSTAHRILGHPDAIQGCMQRTIQFESRNVKLPEGVYSYYEHPRANELIPGAFDWLLLLQLDSINYSQEMWGDTGRLFFWIQKKSLALRQFDRVWLMLQSH
jgi:uncharacterized protein YwqG